MKMPRFPRLFPLSTALNGNYVSKGPRFRERALYLLISFSNKYYGATTTYQVCCEVLATRAKIDFVPASTELLANGESKIIQVNEKRDNS